MHLTYLDANAWLIELADQRILLDPWLVGPLVFGGQQWFFTGKRATPREIPDNIDLILLSQGLPDHAHPPTLKVLDRNIPVIASPSAAQVVEKLGYTAITALAPGEQFTWNQQLKFQAFPGSPIGPFQVENAYVVTDLANQTTLYYEPHGFHSQTVAALGSVDVVITPLTNLNLPVLGPFIKGGDSALELVKWLSPQYIVPTTTIGNVIYSGLLNTIIQMQGTLEKFGEQLQQQYPGTQLLATEAGQRFAVPVAPKVASAETA